jgi:hypothetical protein
MRDRNIVFIQLAIYLMMMRIISPTRFMIAMLPASSMVMARLMETTAR